MSLNTVPTNYHEYEYSKFSVFKLKFMTTGRIHASRWLPYVLRDKARCTGDQNSIRRYKARLGDTQGDSRRHWRSKNH